MLTRADDTCSASNRDDYLIKRCCGQLQLPDKQIQPADKLLSTGMRPASRPPRTCAMQAMQAMAISKVEPHLTAPTLF